MKFLLSLFLSSFFQIAKLCMIPASCLLEVVFDQVRYSQGTKLSIMVVLIGVAVCTVSDVSVNARGLMAAVIAVWSTCLQQYVSLKLSRSLVSWPGIWYFAKVVPQWNFRYPICYLSLRTGTATANAESLLDFLEFKLQQYVISFFMILYLFLHLG